MNNHKLKNFVNNKFQNSVTTSISSPDSEGIASLLRKRCETKDLRSPKNPLQTVKFDTKKFVEKSDAYSWFGHSTLLFRLDGKTIVSDPVFDRTSPVQFLGPAPFPMTNPPKREDLPNNIDILLITHDHYDHLEKKTIKKIQSKVKNFLVPLKVKNTLMEWGISKNKITEFDWYDTQTFENLNFTLTPTRHFSGRGLFDKDKTLWGGWIMESKKKKIYITGDSGYFDQFKTIGENYGPFDLTFVECGQYNEAWRDIHMMPEESIQAGLDAKAKNLIPVHWGKYDLSIHPWFEPITRFVESAKHKNQEISTPTIGKIQSLDEKPREEWWKNGQKRTDN